MNEQPPNTLTRRALLATAGKATIVALAAPCLDLAAGADAAFGAEAQAPALNAVAGVDRVVMQHGRTYLNAWAGYGAPPQRGRRLPPGAQPPPPLGPGATFRWSKRSGPGTVTFADPAAQTTTAVFSEPGEYTLEFGAADGTATAASTLLVKVELPPPAQELAPVVTRRHTITSPFWASRAKALITSWIPHCIEEINRTDIPPGRGDGGIDNFVEAAKALRGEPHGPHKGYVFSNAWVHQTVESICLALMVDPQGDAEIAAAQAKMRATLDDWIPKILAAQHPDGYLQTAFTLRDAGAGIGLPGGVEGAVDGPVVAGLAPEPRGVRRGLFHRVGDQSLHDDRGPRPPALRRGEAAGGLLGGSHRRRRRSRSGSTATRRWSRRWCASGASSTKSRSRAARPAGRATATSRSRSSCSIAARAASEYDQSHLPVQQQYEAVGHAVRAVYTYSGMADVAVETHDVDYQSAVKSLWDNIVHKKYYLTGGVGSGETSEGFGPDYSLRNNALLRGLLELRRDLLPVEAAPGVSPRAVRRSLRADALQRAVRRDGPRRHGLLLHEPARREPAARAVAQLPVLRGQHRADAADAADVDVLEVGRRAVREPLRRQPRRRGRGGRHGRGGGAGDGLSRGTAGSRSR